MASSPPTRRHFTDAAREAAYQARKAKREGPDMFGVPELFVVKAGDQAFTWELRRFGGVVLQRGTESFSSMAQARADGEVALRILCAAKDLPTFKRQVESRPARVRKLNRGKIAP